MQKCEGWMNKLGHINRNWKRRYFVCENGHLKYYSDETRSCRKGSHTFAPTSTIVNDADYAPKRKYTFILFAPGESNVFGFRNSSLTMETSTAEERDMWISVIKNNIFELNKPLVYEHSKTLRPTIVILGCSGKLGTSTVNNLTKLKERDVLIKLATRDLATIDTSCFFDPCIDIVCADMSDPSCSISDLCYRADMVLIIPPVVDNLSDIVIRAVAACAEAEVSHVMMTSVISASDSGGRFSQKFFLAERYLCQSGLKYTITRLALFLDYYVEDIADIYEKSYFSSPIGSDSIHNDVALSDAGQAIAVIMLNPEEFVNKTMSITGHLLCDKSVSQYFCGPLNKQIRHIEISPDQCYKEMIRRGVTACQANLRLEMYKGISDGDYAYRSEPDDLCGILGHPPSNASDFVSRSSLSWRGGQAISPAVSNGELVETESAVEEKLRSIYHDNPFFLPNSRG